MNSGLKKKLLSTAMVLAMGGMLGGCNDGGDDVTSLPTTDTTTASTTLTGTAAGGAAIIGTVTVKDSTGKEKSSLIDSNGRYSVDVSDMAAPFVMRADGQVGDTRVTYYSAATSAGNVNISQFTDLIVANVANQLAESFYASFSGNLDGAALDAAENALQAKLQPVLAALGLDASIDLLRASFAADHTGLDAALDVVRIDYTGDTATLVNTLNDAVLGTDDVTIDADDSTAISGVDAASIQQAVAAAGDIDTWFKNFTALVATSLPSIDQLTASGLIDTTSNFMDRGLSYDEFATELSLDSEVIGIAASNTAITYLNPEQTKASVRVLFTFKNGFVEVNDFQLWKQNGVWKFVGDQRMGEFDVEALAFHSVDLATKTSTSMFSGLKLWVDAESHNAKANTDPADAVLPIASVVVKGPGLPATGVTMSQPAGSAYFTVDGGSTGNQLPDCAVAVSPCVTIAGTVDNGVYTVQLFDANKNLLNGSGYEVRMPSSKPLASADLTAAMFPTITSVTVNGIALTSLTQLATPDTTLGVAWTLPSGSTSGYLNAQAWTDFGSKDIGEDLLPTQTSASLALGNTSGMTFTSAGIWLSTFDAQGRVFAVWASQ